MNDGFNLNRKILGDIDAVFDRAALVALPQGLRRRYVMFLNALCQSKTSIFLISFTYDQSVMQGPPFSVDHNEIAALYSAEYNCQVLFDEPVKISAHLQVKGLTFGSEQVYCLLSKQ